MLYTITCLAKGSGWSLVLCKMSPEARSFLTRVEREGGSAMLGMDRQRGMPCGAPLGQAEPWCKPHGRGYPEGS